LLHQAHRRIALAAFAVALAFSASYCPFARADSPPDDGGAIGHEEAPDASAIKNALPATPGRPSLIRHTLAGRADCVACHGEVAANPYPRDHRGRPLVACLRCHVPAHSPRAPNGEANAPAPPANGYCLSCHADPALELQFPQGPPLSIFVNAPIYARSTHGSKGMPCTACHTDVGHYPHEAIKARSARELSRGIIQQSCFRCHQAVFEQFRESVHGRALVENGNLDVPGCPDCHGVHNIRPPHSVLFRMESPDTCSKCHADKALATKYGMSANVTQSYLNDFHGMSVRLARAEGTTATSFKPVCYDCHGIHDIKKADDPESRVVKGKLVETCRRCHPGAGANFSAAWTKHYEPDRKRWPVVYWVNVAYKLLIPGIIGPMVLYILLDLWRAAIDRWRRRRKA
jgi:hypothetical protein